MHTHKLTISVIIRSLIFWFVAITIGFFITFIATLSLVLQRQYRHKIAVIGSKLYTYLIEVICNNNHIVIGYENVLDTPCIIASNHQSMWETIVFNTIFPPHVWIMKKELLNIPLFGWTIRTLDPIAINRSDRKGATTQILEQGKNRLAQGFYIMLYPEGTRVPPGIDLPFKVGVGRMAQHFNLPIIPVSHNAGYIIPKKKLWIYPGTVTIIIDKPIYPTPEDTYDSITKKVESIIKPHVKQLLRH